MSSCAKETCIHSSVCMYFADRCTTNGDCENFKPPQPKRPSGEWINNGHCSECGGHAPFWLLSSGYYKSNFCPNCGASMTKEGEAE